MQPMILTAYLLCLKLDRCPSSMAPSQNRTSASVAMERFTQLSGLARLFLSNARRSSPRLVYRPAVLMHGIAASASDMNDVANWLRTALVGIYVVSVEIGNGYEDSFLRPLDSQVEEFCTKIRADPRLDRGFNMLGFSQGSLIVRGAVERCSLPVHNLITLNGLHQGVFGIPYLLKLPAQFRHLITHYAYDSFVQNRFSLANSWRDPMQLDTYASQCHFLPYINNERTTRNETYRNNMLRLNAFVMTYSEIDEVVTPKQSGWFMGYAPKSLDVETWNESRQFTEDLLGLRTLSRQGRLFTFISHTRHQDAPHAPNREFFARNLLPFFNNPVSE